MSFIPPSLKERPVENVDAELKYYLFEQHRVRTFVLIGTAAVLELGLAVLYLFVYPPRSADDLQGAITLFIAIPLLMVALPAAIIRGTLLHKYLRHVARMLGYEYSDWLPIESVSGHLFMLGHTPSLSQGFSGMYGSHPFRIYTFTFMTGYGKHKRSHHLYVWELDLQVHLPELMVKPCDLSPTLDWQPSGSVSLRLEGNFNSYFDAWITEQMEIEGLVVLEPHFMTVLIDQYQGYGFATHGSKLYLFRSESVPQNTSAFMEALGKAKRLFDETIPELQQISDDVSAMRAALKM